MREIGHYLELELRQAEHYHKGAIKLNSGRNCLEYILKAKGYKKIYIPHYICEVVLEPMKKRNVDYEFYHINQELEPTQKYKLSENEAFLYVNYHGLKQRTAENLANYYGANLIVDNTQAFYAKAINGIDTFYSPRKFFGVADGAYLYTDKFLEDDFEQDISYERMSHLLKRIDTGAHSGYDDFMRNDASLENQAIKKMSNFTDKILESIDYECAKLKRIGNYKLLEEQLQNSNQIKLEFFENAVPNFYPYFYDDENLRAKFIEAKIFPSFQWRSVLENCDCDTFEHKLAQCLYLLPIDQRYGEKEMLRIIEFIKGGLYA